jgi:hypothetical protein
MATYTVEPTSGINDVDDWKVTLNGFQTVAHRDTKKGAEKTARRNASSGDTLVLKKANGQFQDEITIR